MRDNKDFKQFLISKAFQLSRKTIALAEKFPNKRIAWIITDQLLRAITSMGANIIEAQAASSRKDFINFLNHALKSGNESKFWFALAKDLDSKLIEEIDIFMSETDELVKILGASIATLKGKNKL